MSVRLLIAAWLVSTGVSVVTPVAAEGGTGSDILHLDVQCCDMLDQLWSKYINSSGIDACSAECLKTCYRTLQDSLYSPNNRNCPPQSDIIFCMHVFASEWEAYVKDCELFAWNSIESESESASAPAESNDEIHRRLLSEAEGEGVAGGGCFPDFQNVEDFEKYIDGYWQYNSPSNAAGIGLSVAFFVSLVGLALFLKT